MDLRFDESTRGRGGTVSFPAQQLQLVLVLREEPLEAQVLSDDGQHLAQQLPLLQTLITGTGGGSGTTLANYPKRDHTKRRSLNRLDPGAGRSEHRLLGYQILFPSSLAIPPFGVKTGKQKRLICD